MTARDEHPAPLQPSPTQPSPTQRARVAGTAVAVGLGAAVALQARINGELGQRIDDGLVAALLSNTGGLLLLSVLAVTRPRVRHGLGRVRAAVRDGRLRPVHLLGGVCGAFLVACQGLTVATIGVAVFTVAVVAGQAASGLVVDRAGVGPGGPRPLSLRRVTGAILALAAVLLAVADRLGAPQTLWLAVLPALAGVGTAWQLAANGLVGAAARHDGPPAAAMLPAAVVNFAMGTAALVLVVAMEIAVRGLPRPLPAQPWLYVGGAFGALFAAAAAAIVAITGVLLLGLGVVAGQLLGALLLDLLLPAGNNQLSITTLLGTALTLVAVIVITLPGRRRTGHSRR